MKVAYSASRNFSSAPDCIIPTDNFRLRHWIYYFSHEWPYGGELYRIDVISIGADREDMGAWD